MKSFLFIFCVFYLNFSSTKSLFLSTRKKEEKFDGSSVLDEVPLIDGHNDLPYNLYTFEHNQLQNVDLRDDLTQHPVWGASNYSYTDIPRFIRGKVGGVFWVAYVSCDSIDKDAVELTMDQIDVIHRMIKMYPDHFELAKSSNDILNSFGKGRIASLIAVEGGHSMDNRLGVLRIYYDMGVRYMTLTHSCNLPWADASPMDDNEVATKRNLTAWGRKVVHEMNRLGMMVDISHVSAGVMLDAIEASKAPVIFSHSNSRKVHKHHRNAPDEVLVELKRNQGIIMVNFYTDFLGGDSIDDVIKHLNHIKNLIGSDHVGIGSDFDGMDSTPEGLKDSSQFPNLFNKLAEDGHGFDPWTRDELKKLAGLNLIRVLREVEQVRDSMQKELPYDTPIPYDDLTIDNPTQSCRSDLSKYQKESTLKLK